LLRHSQDIAVSQEDPALIHQLKVLAEEELALLNNFIDQ
jgi:hypothetical protein